MEIRASSRRPLAQGECFEARPVRTQGDRHFALRDQLRFETLEQRHPQAALAGSISPVAADGAARTLAFAHDEKAAPLAAAGILGRVVQREVPLEPLAVGFDEVDTVLIGPPAVAPLPV